MGEGEVVPLSLLHKLYVFYSMPLLTAHSRPFSMTTISETSSRVPVVPGPHAWMPQTGKSVMRASQHAVGPISSVASLS